MSRPTSSLAQPRRARRSVCAGHPCGRLPNSGGVLTLYDCNGALVDVKDFQRTRMAAAKLRGYAGSQRVASNRNVAHR